MNLDFGTLFSPQYLAIFAIAAIVFGTWLYRERRKKKTQKTQDTKEGGEVRYNEIDAVIYDRTTMPYSWYETKLPRDEVGKIVEGKNLSRQELFNGKKVFRFFKLFDPAKKEVVYEGLTQPVNVKHSPIAAYIDNQHPYTPVIDDMKEPKGFMQKYGHLLIWLGALAAVITLIILNQK